MEGTLESCRQKVREIDDEIIELLAKRFQLTDEIGKIKKKTGLPVANTCVETQILERLLQKCDGKVDGELISQIYHEIFKVSKARQGEM